MNVSFANAAGGVVVENLVKVIVEHKAYLSEIDGAIADGDHGINMAKGFTLAKERLGGKESLGEALSVLSRVLMMEIGGSMGPLYGSFFKAMAKACDGAEEVDASLFGRMIEAGYGQILSMGNAKVGDKTLVDVLDPATKAYASALEAGQSFTGALAAMVDAAEKGKESTKELVAKIGRAARLGERSRGTLDAGATSCWLILRSMSESVRGLLS